MLATVTSSNQNITTDLDLVRETILRILANCPVEPSETLYGDYAEIVNALIRARHDGGISAAQEAFNAFKAADPGLEELDTQRLNLYVDDADLQSLLKEFPGRVPQHNLSEVDLAKFFARLFSDRLRYVTSSSKGYWIIWPTNGHAWAPDDASAIVQYAESAIKALQVNAQNLAQDADLDAHKDVVSRLQQLHKFNRRGTLKNIVDLAATEPNFIIRPDQLDNDRDVLSVANGILNLRTGQLRPGRPEDWSSKSVGIPYFPDALAPRWEQFLQEVFAGDQGLINYIQRAVGYALTGHTKEQVFFICHGSGSNGKSVFLEILRRLGSGYAANTPFTTFDADVKNVTGNDIARLRGMRIVTSSETDEGTRLNVARLKLLTGGDRVTCRALCCEFDEYTPHMTIWLSLNHLPHLNSDDDAIWRRVRKIPFNVKFTGEQLDKALVEKLDAELPGILAWAVEGARQWYVNGLTSSESVRTATARYQEQMDTVGQFLSECVDLGAGLMAKAGELYTAYEQWCQETGREALSTVKFPEAVLGRGFERKRDTKTRGNVYLGLALKS